MATVVRKHQAIFRVLDSMEAPYGGWFLKLRFEAGDAPTIRELRSAKLSVSSPDGATSFEVEVQGFPLFGGHPSDDRLHRTGRVDIHVKLRKGNGGVIGPNGRCRGPFSNVLAPSSRYPFS